MTRIKKLSAVGAGAVVLAGGAVLGLSGTAAAGTCGENFDPRVSGAKAYWEINCRGGMVTIEGWVEDTKSDGKCAKVKAVVDGETVRSKAACPKGDREEFKWTGRGSSITAELYTYKV
ncbi:hypothetical protein [Streptomyces dysideae]|nr:hypothetical protein [Streptomyces dysideae]